VQCSKLFIAGGDSFDSGMPGVMIHENKLLGFPIEEPLHALFQPLWHDAELQ